MKLSELTQLLNEYHQNKGLGKKILGFVSDNKSGKPEQITILEGFIEDNKRDGDLHKEYSYEDFQKYCSNKGYALSIFSNKYLLSGSESAKIFKKWNRDFLKKLEQEHVEFLNIPQGVLKHIISFLNQQELAKLSQTCILLNDFIKENKKEFKKLPYFNEDKDYKKYLRSDFLGSYPY